MREYIKLIVNADDIENDRLGIKSEAVEVESILFTDCISIMIQQPDGSTTLSLDTGDINTPTPLNEVMEKILDREQYSVTRQEG